MERIDDSSIDKSISDLIVKNCGNYPLVCGYTKTQQGLENAVKVIKGIMDEMPEVEFPFYLAQFESQLNEQQNS